MVDQKRGNRGSQCFTPTPSHRGRSSKAGTQPHCLKTQYFSTQSGPLPKGSRKGCIWVEPWRTNGTLSCYCYLWSDSDGAETKPGEGSHQAMSSPRLPPSGDISLLLRCEPTSPMVVSVAAWTPLTPWPIFACLILLRNWTGCRSLLTWLVGSLTQQKWDLRGLKREKKIIQIENSSFSSRALD